MSDTPTLSVTASIDVGVDGIRITIESLDADLANLIKSAGDFTVTSSEYHTYDTSTLVIKSKKALQFVDPPVTPTTPTTP